MLGNLFFVDKVDDLAGKEFRFPLLAHLARRRNRPSWRMEVFRISDLALTKDISRAGALLSRSSAFGSGGVAGIGMVVFGSLFITPSSPV
jgi:hypothetical protein